MYGTIELTTAGFGGAMISLFCLFLFLLVGATLQDGDSDSADEDSMELDPEFLTTVEACFNDVIRCLSRRNKSSEYAETKGDSDDDERNEREEWLEEVETIFDDADEEEDLFASNDEEESEDDDSQKEEPDPNGRSNFSGAFFKNRNYPRDVYESESEGSTSRKSDDEPPRWRRAKDDDVQETSDSARRDKFDEGASDDDAFDSDEDYLDDDTPIEDRIAKLRERLQNGDESSRIELVQLLIESVASARTEEKDRFFRTLDEAQTLLDEAQTTFDEDYDEAECQIALQRPVFYMRNNLKPPFELVTAALQRIREWRQKSDSPASRALLARAWLLHGQRLLASGSSAAALASFQKARVYFKPPEDSYDDSESKLPALGFVLISEADAYRMAGDVDKAIAAYREAADIFDEFRTKRVFLAQKANVLCQLSLTLRAVGRFKDALGVMSDAIAVEERLFSYDSSKYFSGLAQLLRIQADTCFKNNEVDSAFALMDRAESIILTSLQTDVPLRRRVLAYMQLVHLLRSRAGMNLVRRKFEASRRDVLNALHYLSTAVEKEDDLNPGPPVVAIFALVYDMVALTDRLDEGKTIHGLVDQIVALLTTRERRAVDSLYAELLLHMHMVNASEKRFDDALEMTNAAIKMLEDADDAEESRDDVRRQFLLAKALYQRGSYYHILRHDHESALADFDRIDALYSETDLLSESESLPLTREFYVEFLWRYSCVLWSRNDIQKSRIAITTACRVFMTEVASGAWSLLPALKKLTYVTLRFAEEEDQSILFLRLARFWVKYIQFLRRDFLENGWNIEDSDSETKRNSAILNELDETLLNVFMTRVRFVENHPWRTEYERFLPRDVVGSGREKLAGVGPEPVASYARDEAAFPERFTPEELYEAREKFVREKLSATPNKLFQWLDLQKCVRYVERQIETGCFSHMSILVFALNMLNDMYWEHGETRLAVTEISGAARVVAKVAARKDKDFRFSFDNVDDKTNAPTAIDAVSSSEEQWDEFEDFDPFSNGEDEDNPDDLFWNGAFFIEQFQLVALERLFLGKETELHVTVDSTLVLKGENEAASWFRNEDEEDDEADESPFDDSDDSVGEFSDSETSREDDGDPSAGRDDYRRLDPEKAALVERTFETALFYHRKSVKDELWRYYQRLILLKHYFDWLMARGRGDVAKAKAMEQIEALEPESKSNSFLACFLMFFCSMISDSAMATPKDSRFARELLFRIVALYNEIGTTATALLPDPFMGKTYLRLAFLASEEGDSRKEAEFLRRAAAAFALGLGKDSFNTECFEEATKLVNCFFASDDPEDKKLARKLFRKCENSFDCHFEALKRGTREGSQSATQSLAIALIAFMRAASFFDSERKCFHEARRLYRKTESIMAFLSENGTNELPFEICVLQSEAIAFYARYALMEDHLRLTKMVSSACRKLFEDAKDNGSDQEIRREIHRMILRLNLTLIENEIFQGDSSIGDSSTAVQLVEETVAAVRSLPEFIGLSLEETSEKGLRSLFRRNHVEPPPLFRYWGLNYFMALEFSEFVKARDNSLTLVNRNLATFLKEIRKIFGKKSWIEFVFLYYWADFALRREQWTTAARVSSRFLREFGVSSESGNDMMSDPYDKMVRLDSMKIEATARIERGRPGDLRRAEKTLCSALGICVGLFAQRFFQIRPIFAELLVLKAKVDLSRKRYEQALDTARRARGIIERCEKRGMTNWLPLLRREVGPLTEKLKEKVAELRRDSSNCEG